MAKRDPQAKQAFIDAAIVAESDECIDWPWWKLPTGYPKRRLSNPRRESYVHVEVCEAVHGPRPKGREAAHSCGRPCCINGRHLSWKLPVENMADTVIHGTKPAGPTHGQAKLDSYEQAAEIRSLAKKGVTQRQIGIRFGIGQSTVSLIVSGKIWKSPERVATNEQETSS